MNKSKKNTNCCECDIPMKSKNKDLTKSTCRNCLNKKKAIEKPCLQCNKLTLNPKFCSQSCAAKITGKKFPKRKTTRICTKCNNKVKSYKHSLCDFHTKEYQESKVENYKNKPLKEYWNRPGLESLHPSSKSSHIRIMARTWNKDILAKPCANCGYDKHVELCHIKAIRDFDENSTIGEVNSPNNLIQLCPNCHWEFDNYIITLEYIKRAR